MANKKKKKNQVIEIHIYIHQVPNYNPPPVVSPNTTTLMYGDPIPPPLELRWEQ